MARLLTLGETLGVGWTPVGVPLGTASSLQLSTAGAESTVAVGMARLGHDAVWVGAVGDDALGARIVRELRAERVDTRFVRTEPAAPTGFMLRDRKSAERVGVSYYRQSSAGSRLSAADVDAAFDGLPTVDVVHVTGITAVLSESCREAVQRAVQRAREAAAMVSFDVNLRRTLPYAEDLPSIARRLLADVDLLFVGDDELEVVSDTSGDEALDDLLRAGPREVVLKRGAAGAETRLAGGERASTAAPRIVVADTIGAGDSFVAGYLSAMCDGRPVADRLRRGVACAAATIGTHGDWEGLPTMREIDTVVGAPVTVR